MFWTWMIACGLQPWDNLGEDTGQETLQGEGVVEFDPVELDFGDQSIDTPSEQLLSVRNNGDGDLIILDATHTATSGLELSAPPSLLVQPGQEAIFTVNWTPVAVGQLTTDLTFEFESSEDEVLEVMVPVTGAGQGPVLSMSTNAYDFGDVNVGCDSELSVTVSNAGNESLEIDDFVLGGEASYDWSIEDDAPPWTLGPFESRDIRVVFSPDETTTDAAILEVLSGIDTYTTVLTGTGTVDGSETVTYVVGEQAYATFLFAVNAAVTPGAYDYYGFGENLEAALPAFFETLQDNHATFRAGFIVTTNGEVSGSNEYIDETFSVSDATDAALSMLESATGDNDEMFTTLMAGVTQNSDWLFEDDNWSNSKLSLIAMNNDTEQSSGSYAQYVATAQAYKEEKENVVFHGVGGPDPSGCTYSDPFSGYFDAVTMTDGLLLDICETDWEPHMEKLAAASISGSDYLFPLTGTPLVSSITVKVDGFTETDTWDYDEGKNAIVFYDESPPQEESTVEITYLTSDGCG